MKLKMLDRRDVFLLLGITSLVGGICAQWGAAWGAMALGGLLLLFGMLGGGK